MKRYLMMSLLLLGLSHAGAQAQGSYDDDIYYNSSDIEAQKDEDRKEADNRQSSSYNDNSRASNRDNGDYETQGRSYESDGDYMDDDGSNYATRFRRFNQPFYNMGYWSPYYNPYWYDPFWSDPYWGWSPWYRPGFSISFGMGPYWSSGWGWNTWWGYSPFNSYWGYPYYGSWYGNYYGGYWNGFYDGMYAGGGIASVRNVNYGPRRSANSASNMGLRAAQQSVGVRRLQTAQAVVNEPRQQQRATPITGTNTNNNSVRADRDRTVSNTQQTAERPRRGFFSRDENAGAIRSNEAVRGSNVQEARPSFGERQPRQASPRFESAPRYEAPRQNRVEMQRSEPRYQAPQRSYESAPRFEQRSQPNYSAPRMSSPSPRMSAPSSSPMRSGGGGGFNGGGSIRRR